MRPTDRLGLAPEAPKPIAVPPPEPLRPDWTRYFCFAISDSGLGRKCVISEAPQDGLSPGFKSSGS